ncbi:MAG TPA: hypothetical protein V6D08_09980 [Candidatus Obscuribacterales bacterium]
MGSSEELKAILEERLGYFPAFLLPALPYPEQLQELGRHTLSSYVDNPIPALFKESKVSVKTGDGTRKLSSSYDGARAERERS